MSVQQGRHVTTADRQACTCANTETFTAQMMGQYHYTDVQSCVPVWQSRHVSTVDRQLCTSVQSRTHGLTDLGAISQEGGAVWKQSEVSQLRQQQQQMKNQKRKKEHKEAEEKSCLTL